MPLNKLFKTQLQPVPRKVVIWFAVIALIGFVDASYLTVEHYQNTIPPCTVGGCEQVLTSAFSKIGPVPVSLLGAIYYLIVLVGSIIYIDSRNAKLLKKLLLFTFLGFLASVFFLIIQAFVLHAYCLYCLGSAVTSTILFVMAMVILKKYRAIEYSNN